MGFFEINKELQLKVYFMNLIKKIVSEKYKIDFEKSISKEQNLKERNPITNKRLLKYINVHSLIQNKLCL